MSIYFLKNLPGTEDTEDILDREEKRNLMRAIEEEIYQEIIEEYGL